MFTVTKYVSTAPAAFTVLVLCASLCGSGVSAQNLAWAPQRNIAGFVSTKGPSLAVFENRLFAAWKGFRLPGGNDSQGIYWSSFDGTDWADRLATAGFISIIGPSLAVFENRLFAAWKGARYPGGYDDQGFFWSSFDGTDWADQAEVADFGSAIGPSLAVFGNRLFAAWRGAGGDQGIYWSSFDGTGWAPRQNIPGVATSIGPSLAVFQNRLFAAWKGAGNDEGIWWSSFDGVTPSAGGATGSPDRSESHAFHAGHQEPSCSAARTTLGTSSRAVLRKP